MASTIPVIVDLAASREETKSILQGAAAKVHAKLAVDVDRLKENLTDLVQKLGNVITAVEGVVDAFPLHEVEVGIEITAEGGVALIGTLGATASMKLTFQRKA